MKNIQQPELQLRTLRLYGEFLCRRESWSGQLVLAAFDNASATGFAAAASLAGASSLTVDSDSETMKAHFRDGAFDFIVNTFDEALRAIKNEIRQGRPIAIGLMAKPAAALAEATERGLAAAFVLRDSARQEQDLLAAVSEPDAPRIADGILAVASPEFSRWLAERVWQPVEMPAEAFPVADEIRERWVRNLTTHQRSVRRGKRWMWMSQDEERKLKASVRPELR